MKRSNYFHKLSYVAGRHDNNVPALFPQFVIQGQPWLIREVKRK